MKTVLPIRAIRVRKRYRNDLGDLDALAESIRANGLLHPIVITPGRCLIAGLRRLRACQKLGWDKIPVRMLKVSNLLLAEHDENELRKDFTTSERVAIAGEIERKMGKRQGQRTDQELRRNCAEVDPGERTDEVAARKAGFSGRDEYRRAKSVVANGAAELVEALDRGQVSPSAAAEIATLPREEQRDVIRAGPEAVTTKAKEVREARAEARRNQTARYPHSDRLRSWLQTLFSETHVIQIELGGLKKLLAEPDGWDWREVREYHVPMLELAVERTTEYLGELNRALQQRGS